MLVKCGKLQKNVENSPKNVENMWKSASKMWITAPKMWKTLWRKCGNVENMWKTHLYVQMCKIVANYTNVSQFFFFFFFSCAGTCAGTYVSVCGGALQLYALARGTERERRTCNEWLCTGVMITFVDIYILVSYYLYIQVFNIFNAFGSFHWAYQWLYKIQGICFIVLGFCLCFTISLKKFYIRVGAVDSAWKLFSFFKSQNRGGKSTFKTYPTPPNNSIHNFGQAIEIQ